ncbi:NaeI family type II restriction endonuclease [Streptomyces sp. NPDC127077]|uniref:NaeI family type II restriction endonuclease n=1 Tax=Streptomyces sp. NPDC127077 TaxID=3347131 RepID=UPI00364CFCC5
MLLLRDIRSQAQLSVEDVHELLRTSGHLKDQLPGRSTLYRKLSGAGLRNERRLVETVIKVCVFDEQRADALREQAISLLQQAWSKDAEPVPAPRPVMTPGNDASVAELIRVQRELIEAQAKLTAALQTAAAAEKESAGARALVSVLLMLRVLEDSKTTNASAMALDSTPGASLETELSALRIRLAAVEAERDEARRAMRAKDDTPPARDGRFGDPANSPNPAPTSPLEWPTTRVVPAQSITLADPTHGTGAAAAGAHGSLRQHAPSVEGQAQEGVRVLEQDVELAAVLAEMLRLDPDGSRTGAVIDGVGRHALDPVHTGRYLWAQLNKAERMVLGVTMGQRMQRELGLADGLSRDFMVAGHEVDIKFSQGNNWAFPPELQGGLCLVVQADDATGRWSLGLLRVKSDLMRTGSNRDGKRGLSAQGRKAIQWIHHDLPLPEHALRRLPADAVDAVFARSSGQARVEELFLRAQLTAITTADLSAVAMQSDGIKRVRDARRVLARRGVLVMGGTKRRGQQQLSGLGLPVLAPGTWMSVRLVPAPTSGEEAPTISLDGTLWRVAHPDDPEVPLPPSAII